jgi:PAS domain S-box-containing protein
MSPRYTPARRWMAVASVPFARYLVAVLGGVLAFFITALAFPLLQATPGVIFLAAVTFVAWYGGFGPGLLTCVLAVLGLLVLLADNSVVSGLNLLGFLLVASLITIPIERLRMAERRSLALVEAQAQAYRELEAIRQALATSEENFRLALSQPGISVFRQDLALRYLWFHNATEPQAAESIVGSTDADLLPPKLAEPLQAVKQQVLTTGEPAHLEVVAAGPNGPTPYDALFTPSRDPNGEIVGLNGVSFDITARRQVEQALRQSEARLAAVWNSAPDAMVLSDSQGQVRAVNPSYCELYGFTPEELLDRSFAVIFPEEAQEFARAQYQAVFTGSDSLTSYEATVRRADGTERLVEARISFLTEGEERVAMLSIIRDITRRKQIEAQLEHLATENAGLYQQAQQALQLRNQALAQVAHDLRNPLTVISAQAQLLQNLMQRKGADAAPQVASGLQRIDQRARGMDGQLNELLDVAQLAMGQALQIIRRPTDLVALTHEVIADIELVGETHDLRVEASAKEIWGEWDRTRLDRVLRNLLNNARKYSPPGSLITVRVDEGDGLLAPPDWVRLVIQDQGIGIPEANLATIFERFQRGANVAGLISGTGLGLAGVRAVIEQHGGTVALESVEGQGTTVTLRLPRAGEDSDSATEELSSIEASDTESKE